MQVKPDLMTKPQVACDVRALCAQTRCWCGHDYSRHPRASDAAELFGKTRSTHTDG
jgi:hypothetical protein